MTKPGAEEEQAGSRLHLLLDNDQLLIAEAGDHIHLCSGLVQCLGSGVGNGTAHAAADDSGLPDAGEIGGSPQRTHKVQDAVPGLQTAQQIGGQAHLLEDDGDSACFGIGIGNGERHPLAVFIDAEDDELTGPCFFCNERCLDLHQGHLLVEVLFICDPIHGVVLSLR